MTIGVHDNAIWNAKHALQNIQEGKTDVQNQTALMDFNLEKANEAYDLAKGAREYANEYNYPSMQWPEDEHGMVKSWTSYPDGKTDVISDNDKYGAFKTSTITYDDVYDNTPNSIRVEYYNPATDYTYDKNGNCTKIVESKNDKVQSVESFAYNDLNQIVYHEIDKNNDGTVDEKEYMQYCEHGHLAQVIEEDEYLNTRTTFNCDGTKKSIEFFDELRGQYGGKTEFTYDCSGRLESQRTKDDYVDDYYQFNYDGNNNLTSAEYENKFTKTLKGFFLNLFGDFDKDTVIDIQQ